MSLAQRILVVEDECVLAQNVKTYLARRCPDVRIAANGAHVMQILADFTPDMVVLDLGLSGKNGFEIYQEMVRQRAGPIGCVMITGYPLEQITERANMLGIRHVLNKPFRLSELQQLIDQSAEEMSRALH